MDATLRDRAVVLGETLVCADLHVGKAEASSVDFPLGEREHLLDRLETLLECHEPTTVVFAGDLLHSFDRVPSHVENTATAIFRTVREADAEAVVTPGNHDTMLDVIWEGTTTHEFVVDGVPSLDGDGAESGTTVVCHGHAEPSRDANCYVVGHDHPTITIEGRKWHCYLYGTDVYDGADVLVLPAFSRLIEGVSINRRFGTAALNSPLIEDLGAFRPVVRDDDEAVTRAFPPLAEFRDLL